MCSSLLHSLLNYKIFNLGESIYHNLQQVKIDLSQFEHPIYKIHKFNKGLIT